MSKPNRLSDATYILIVEDDTLLNYVMALQVQVAGYAVQTARSGAQALKIIQERIPSVLIMDVGLPDMTGQELTAELRLNPLTCTMPLIVHTTLDLSRDDEMQLTLGPTKFVTKTKAFSEQMAELIRELIGTE